MQALEGIKVIDFSKWLPGQYCGMVLGDFGADITKVEDIAGDNTRKFTPEIAPGMSYWHLALNRNKKSIAVNLRTEAGRDIVHKLVRQADVLLEGFRPGFMAKIGLDYAALRKENPRLVYCSVTGFGQTGKFCHKPAHDMNVVGLSGMTYLDAKTGGAVVADVQFSALGGALNALAGILLALLARERTGEGQYVDVSLYNSALSEQTTIIGSLWGCQEQGTKPFGRIVHYYNVYETADGRYLSVGTIEPKFWVRVCQLVGHEELAARQFDFEHGQELRSILEAAFKTKTQQEWLDLIGTEDFCVTPICSLKEAMESELTAESAMLTARKEDVGEVRYVQSPIKLGATPAAITKRAPRLGEHTDKVLLALGYCMEDIRSLRACGDVL